MKNNYLGQFLPLLLAAVLLTGCGKDEVAAPAIRPALAFKLGNGTGTDHDVYAGEIRARIESDHAFRIGGKIVQRLVDTGATVHKGQLLARLDPQDVKLNADAAHAQVIAQQTDAEFAQAELTRYQDLFNKGFVSQSALDQKINAAKAAKAKLDATRAQADVSVNQAGYTALHAEMDGVVTQVLAEVGQVVAQGQAVVRIANPKEKELAISAPELKLAEFRNALKQGAHELRVAAWANPEKYFAAKIREIGGAADSATRTYAIRLSLPNADDSLQLGMTAYAVFGGTGESTALTVPLSALYAQGEKTGVWLIGADGKLSLKPVKVVQFRETSAAIQAQPGTLKPGDIIVAAGVHKLREGETVKPIFDPQIVGDGKVAQAYPQAANTAQAENDAALLPKRLN
jgi:RND family efflux transporter MFP subunit